MSRYYQPTQLHFGSNKTDDVGVITAKYGTKVLMITSNDAPLKNLYERVRNSLEGSNLKVTHFEGVVPNPTVESVECALRYFDDSTFDVIVVVGGGSAIDTAKAVVFKHSNPTMSWETIFEDYSSPVPEYPPLIDALPIIAIPTTSGTGSHVTQASVLSTGSEKLTLFHQQLFSTEAIIDPMLTTTLPLRMTAATAFDTFTHAFESYISHRSHPLTHIDSLKAMELVINNLPKVLQNPSSVTLREQLSIADTLGGRALANAGASAPHPLSEIIGGITGAVHGEALACVYPAFIHESLEMYREQFDVVAKLFNPSATAESLELLIKNFLSDIGLTRTLESFISEGSQMDKILFHPALDHLPFGDRTYFERILKAS